MRCKTCKVNAVVIWSQENKHLIAKYTCFCGRKIVVEKEEKVKPVAEDVHEKNIVSLQRRQRKVQEDINELLNKLGKLSENSRERKHEIQTKITKLWDKLTITSTKIAELH